MSGTQKKDSDFNLFIFFLNLNYNTNIFEC